jgi:hypothetical protein
MNVFASKLSNAVQKLTISNHANSRAQERSMPRFSAEMAIYFGEEHSVRGARKLVITPASVQRAAECGIDLALHSGVVFICNAGTVITGYQKCSYRVLALAA